MYNIASHRRLKLRALPLCFAHFAWEKRRTLYIVFSVFDCCI